jgi:hypothetical protein
MANIETSREMWLIKWAKRSLKARLCRAELDRFRRRWAEPAACFFSGNLRNLAQIYGSDKWAEHWYAQHYQNHFGRLRRKSLTLLEIGIGGYKDPLAGGGSLRMWRKFFPHGRIYGIDIEDKSHHNERRILTFQGDQTDERFLRRVIEKIGPPDIIVDDGSHVNTHVIQTFRILFPLMAERGYYAAEDLQTAYWPEYGGSSEQLDASETSMKFFRQLADGLNYEEYIRPGYQPTYFDQRVIGMHFYHGLVIVEKGVNNEGSYYIRNNLPRVSEELPGA